MKINHRGFTIVELVLSFALISVIVIGMLSIVINYRSMVKISNRKIELVQYKVSVTKEIQDDILEFGINNVSYCTNTSKTCVTFTFKNGTTKNLSYSNSDVQNRYIQYGSQKFPIQEPNQDDFVSLSDALVHLPSERAGITLSSVKSGEDTIFKVRIPIIADDIDEDFGLFIVTSDIVNTTLGNQSPSDEKFLKDEAFATGNLGINCIAYNEGVDTFLVGRCSQNYVWYSGKLWRVVSKNNETGAVKMVTDNVITTIPYNASGNIAFENSYMDQWLNQEFLPTLHDYQDYLVVDSVWDATADTNSRPPRPNGTTTVTRAVGLLNSYEYYMTYAGGNGLTTYSTGYLNNGVSWLLITIYTQSSVRIVYRDGNFNNIYPSTGDGARPAVNVKPTVTIDSGIGTISDPYKLEGDSKEIIAGTTLLSTRYSGEYVTFNNELYRIVEIENGLTKITAVDKPSSLVANVFDSSSSKTTNFADASIKADLETYYQNLSQTWKNMIQPSTVWYLGAVEDGANYKASICSTINPSVSMRACTSKATSTSANIGLPRVGEMFTSLITRGQKTSLWTLTPSSQSNVRNVYAHGNLLNSTSANVRGARPSMYLKSTVKIASNNTGNGTYEKPYQISLN